MGGCILSCCSSCSRAVVWLKRTREWQFDVFQIGGTWPRTMPKQYFLRGRALDSIEGEFTWMARKNLALTAWPACERWNLWCCVWLSPSSYTCFLSSCFFPNADQINPDLTCATILRKMYPHRVPCQNCVAMASICVARRDNIELIMTPQVQHHK